MPEKDYEQWRKQNIRGFIWGIRDKQRIVDVRRSGVWTRVQISSLNRELILCNVVYMRAVKEKFNWMR